jgi:uracil-DNA glycosylase
MPDAATGKPRRGRPGSARELARLRTEASGCRSCPLWRPATQTVFGEAPPSARIMLVGEQPGDREDLEGRPFVGPAGRILDKALERAGIERSAVYATNVVKHFKFRARGRRRIHQRPAAGEIAACRQWISAELELVEPEILVCLGGTASHALLGPKYSVERDRGKVLTHEGLPPALITAHPSAALRKRDAQARNMAIDALAADLGTAARAAGFT